MQKKPTSDGHEPERQERPAQEKGADVGDQGEEFARKERKTARMTPKTRQEMASRMKNLTSLKSQKNPREARTDQ